MNPEDPSGKDGRRDRPRPPSPDILFHATTAERLEAAIPDRVLTGAPQRPVFLSPIEPQAWRVAHRFHGETPIVLVVDAARARRHGVRFQRNRRNGLYMVDALPLRDVMNLQAGYGEQLSAGGIPVAVGADGRPKVALIRVSRRSGSTWEVAKGKLEDGEPPEIAAIREVREEMGVEADFDVLYDIGALRYGFQAPGGLPRLKTVFLYLLRPLGELASFAPSTREGIGEVRWFTPDDACNAIRHPSLVPVMRHARGVLLSGAVPVETLPRLAG